MKAADPGPVAGAVADARVYALFLWLLNSIKKLASLSFLSLACIQLAVELEPRLELVAQSYLKHRTLWLCKCENKHEILPYTNGIEQVMTLRNPW